MSESALPRPQSVSGKDNPACRPVRRAGMDPASAGRGVLPVAAGRVSSGPGPSPAACPRAFEPARPRATSKPAAAWMTRPPGCPADLARVSGRADRRRSTPGRGPGLCVGVPCSAPARSIRPRSWSAATPARLGLSARRSCPDPPPAVQPMNPRDCPAGCCCMKAKAFRPARGVRHARRRTPVDDRHTDDRELHPRRSLPGCH